MMYGVSRQTNPPTRSAFEELGQNGQTGVVLANMILLLLFIDIPMLAHDSFGMPRPRYFFVAFALLSAPWWIPLILKLREFDRNPLVIWLALFALGNLLFLQLGTAAMSEMATKRLQLALFGICITLLASVTRCYQWRLFIPIAIVINILAICFDLIVPGALHPRTHDPAWFERPSGLYANQNDAGQALLVLTAYFLLHGSAKWKSAVLIAVGIAIGLTFSRAGLLGWIFLMAAAAGFRLISVAGFASALGTLVLLMSIPMMLNDVIAPILGYEQGNAGFFDRMQSIRKFEFEDESSAERLQAAFRALNIFLESPFLGAGPGATEASGNTGPHNQVLLLAAEYGAMGATLWIVLILLIFSRCLEHSLAMAIMMTGLVVLLSLFTHSMLDDSYWTIAFAMMTIRISDMDRPTEDLPVRA